MRDPGIYYDVQAVDATPEGRKALERIERTML